MNEVKINVNPEEKIRFYNQADYCIGTGRMGLALQKEYLDQLALVQKEIGFKYIRGHGLFSDDMAIYQEYETAEGEIKAEYNFTYLDRVIDAYLELDIRPFLELGFMPEKLASGTQTVFYWEGNVTPPKSYEGWSALVQATLTHLLARYGEEVVTWPVEVWNEPNLAGFWKDADMAEYFKLFAVTFAAVKNVDSRFQVGGPAICGVDDERWLQEFLVFCQQEKIELDSVTRHFYTIDMPEHNGHYSYVTLRNPDECLQELTTSREIIDSFTEYKDLPMHITEFNTSYSPDSPMHDTNQNAAYIAYLLSKLGETSESYSYWTFGDVFEELGVPFTPFHGGFGLVANGVIPKPTFWTFAFFKKLQGVCVHKDENSLIVKQGDEYRGILWNCQNDIQNFEVVFPFAKQNYCIVHHIVDEETTNPLKVWHDLGEPSSLSLAEKELLQTVAKPFVSTTQIESSEKAMFSLSSNGVCYFEVKPVNKQNDRGYEYQKVMKG